MIQIEWAGVPYCGEPPLPDRLLSAWNVDPWLLAGFAFAAFAAWAMGRRGGDGARRARWFGLGLVLLFVAFVSPLCALSSALFSARVAHHLLLISVAAPLLALAFPARGGGSGARLALLVLAHVVAVWVWHAPAPYGAALASDALYWTMEATLLGSAILVWRELLSERTHALRGGLAHLAIIATMGLLGALITFAPLPLYAPHFLTTIPYGLDALEDQQLAGLLMWVPAILPNLVAALLCLRRLVEDGAADARASAA